MYSTKYYKTSKLYQPRCKSIHPGLYRTSDYCPAHWVNNYDGPKYAWETVSPSSRSTELINSLMICETCGDQGPGNAQCVRCGVGRYFDTKHKNNKVRFCPECRQETYVDFPCVHCPID